MVRPIAMSSFCSASGWSDPVSESHDFAESTTARCERKKREGKKGEPFKGGTEQVMDLRDLREGPRNDCFAYWSMRMRQS